MKKILKRLIKIKVYFKKYQNQNKFIIIVIRNINEYFYIINIKFIYINIFIY